MGQQLSITNDSGRPIRDLLLVMESGVNSPHYLSLHSMELVAGGTAHGSVPYQRYYGPFYISFFDGTQAIFGDNLTFMWDQSWEPQPIQITHSGEAFMVENAYGSPLSLKAVEHPADLRHEVIWVTPKRKETSQSTTFELEFSGTYTRRLAVDRDTAEKTFFFARVPTAEKEKWDVKLKACSFRYRSGVGPWNRNEVDSWLRYPGGLPQPSETDPGSVIEFRLPDNVVYRLRTNPAEYKSILLDYTLDVGIDPEVEMESGS